MVAEIVGSFLIERGIITKGQMLILQKERQKVRACLGLVAVSAGYMASDEVKAIYEEINTDGVICDSTFADTTVLYGYLTEGQIKSLAYKQNDSYLCFVQALEKLKIIDLESLENILKEYPAINNEAQLADLKSNDANRILPLFIPPEAGAYINAACCAIRFLANKVGNNICPKQAFLVSEFQASNGVFQFAKGCKEYAFALVGRETEMAYVATCYMRERYDGINDEVLDIISEIVNKISSSYGTELGQDGIVVDLMPPQTYLTMKKILADEMLVLPLTIKNDTFYLLISITNDIQIY
ncbi:MAG: hypothetical protein FWC09_04510 [Lachnospiraceae bacterium]|nr:hypothetical protein [Lachnospiraceae bacterium]